MCRACRNPTCWFWLNTHCKPRFRWTIKFVRGSNRPGGWWRNRYYIYWLGREWVYEPERTPR